MKTAVVWGLMALVASLSPGPAQACINTYHAEYDYDRRVDGQQIPLDNHGPSYGLGLIRFAMPLPMERYNPEQSRNTRVTLKQLRERKESHQRSSGDAAHELQALEAAVQKEPSLANRNDHAVALIRAGKHTIAIGLLEQLEKEFPGEYQVAANLGTAYELAGNNPKALQWIRTGVERNPHSHEGSEWVHVKILEAKIHEQKTPGWLKTRSVVGVSFGTQPLPASPKTLPAGNDGNPVTIAFLQESIAYQLKERSFFVDAPDPIMGDLFFDYGQAAALTQGVNLSVDVLKVAQAYGAPREALLAKRLSALETRAKNYPPLPLPKPAVVVWTILGMMTLGTLWLMLAWRMRAIFLHLAHPTSGQALLWSLVGTLMILSIWIGMGGMSLLAMGFLHPGDTTILRWGYGLFVLSWFTGLFLLKQRAWGWLLVFPWALILPLAGLEVFACFTLLVTAWAAGRLERLRQAALVHQGPLPLKTTPRTYLKLPLWAWGTLGSLVFFFLLAQLVD